jgi:hypothetical protein
VELKWHVVQTRHVGPSHHRAPSKQENSQPEGEWETTATTQDQEEDGGLDAKD